MEFRTCQWIDGEPTADDSCKCGRPVSGETGLKAPYCKDHAKRVTNQVPAHQPGREAA